MADDTDLVQELGDIFGETPEEEKAETPPVTQEEVKPEPEGDAHSAAPEPDKVEQKDAEQATTQPVFDERLLQDAESLGIPREFAATFSTPQDLEKHLWVVSRMQPVANATQQPATQQEKDEFFEAVKAIKENESDYDPVLVKVVYGLAEKNARLEEAMLATMSAEARRVQEVQSIREKEATETWDKLFNDSELPEVFGTGNFYGDRKNISESQMANRHRVAAVAKSISRGYAEMGVKPPDNRELLLRAIRAEFPDATQNKTQQDLAKQLSARESQLVARPRTSKAASGKSAREHLHEAYVSVMGDHGAPEDYLDQIFGK